MNSQTLAADAAAWKSTSSGTQWERFRDSGSLDSTANFADSPFERWPLQISALLGLSVVVAALVLVGPLHHPSHLVTATGEQRNLVLADGSILDLRSDSDARTAFTAQERRVVLSHGEARFSAAQEPARPFLVSTRHATVKTAGATFEVRTSARETMVKVLRGRIDILPPLLDETPGANESVKVLLEGEQAYVSRQGEVLVLHALSAKLRM